MEALGKAPTVDTSRRVRRGWRMTQRGKSDDPQEREGEEGLGHFPLFFKTNTPNVVLRCIVGFWLSFFTT